jgi:endosialidase-like protein
MIALLLPSLLFAQGGAPPAPSTMSVHLTGIVPEDDPEEKPFSGPVDSLKFYASETGQDARGCGTFDPPGKVKKGNLHAEFTFDPPSATCPFGPFDGEVWLDLHTTKTANGNEIPLKRIRLYQDSLPFPVRATGLDLAPAISVGPSGRIGIGTTSPAAQLHLSHFGAASGTGLRITNTSFPQSYELNSGIPGYDNTSFSINNVTSGATPLVINNSGNVGIGFTTPEFALDVRGPSAGTIARFNNSSNTAGIQLGTLSESESFVSVGTGDDLLLFSGTSGGSTEGLRIKAGSGNVGIGLTNPSARLEVNGLICATNVACSSSARWKRDVRRLENALEKVQRLRGVSFEWKSDGRDDIGFIAEEVADVIPEVVAYEANGIDAKAVDYGRLTALLVEAMKAQQAEIEEMRKELRALKPTQD